MIVFRAIKSDLKNSKRFADVLLGFNPAIINTAWTCFSENT